MKKIRFNQGWTVEEGDGGAFSALLGGGAVPKAVVLPHDLLVEIPRNPSEPNGPGNGYFHEVDMVYKSVLKLDEEAAGKRVFLEFEGVYQNAFVYVNDAFAGKCAYGYSNFYLDVTRFVKPGQDNAVKVIVKDGVPSGRWYTGGGIYRDVNLMIANPTHIDPDGVFVSASDITEEMASVKVQIEVSNDVMEMKSVVLKATLCDADGAVAAQNTMPVTLSDGQKASFLLLHLQIALPDQGGGHCVADHVDRDQFFIWFLQKAQKPLDLTGSPAVADQPACIQVFPDFTEGAFCIALHIFAAPEGCQGSGRLRRFMVDPERFIIGGSVDHSALPEHIACDRRKCAPRRALPSDPGVPVLQQICALVSGNVLPRIQDRTYLFAQAAVNAGLRVRHRIQKALCVRLHPETVHRAYVHTAAASAAFFFILDFNHNVFGFLSGSPDRVHLFL